MLGEGLDTTEEHEQRKQEHECTDAPCCILFLVCTLAWAVCFGYGVTNGNLKKIFHGITTVNNVSYVCGVDAPYQEQGVVYWCWSGATDIQNFKAVCLSSCPNMSSTTSMTAGMVMPPALSAPVPAECGVGYQGYDTFSFLNKYCLPNTTSTGTPLNVKNMTETMAEQQGGDFMSQLYEALAGLQEAIPVLVMAFVLSLVFGYLYLIALKCCAEPLIWLTMITTITGFGIGAGYLWTNADMLHEEAAKNTAIPESLTSQTKLTAQLGAAFCGIVSIVLVLVTCCFCSSIKTAARIIEVACETMWEMPVLLISPLLKAILKGSSYAAIGLGFLYIISSATIIAGPDGMSRHFQLDGTQKLIVAFYTFHSCWLIAWVNAYYQFIVAYIVADYYYAPFENDDGDKDVDQCSALGEGLYHGAVTHSGSLAYGSLLIAIIEFLQKVLEYAEKKNQETTRNKVVTCLIGCALCCLSCIKETIEFINKNAYIDIAIAGVDGFCAAGQNAIQVITQSAGTMAILNGATIVFSVFGSMLITFLTTAITYFVVGTGTFASVDGPGSDQAVPDEVVVCVVAAFISMGVSFCFMNVFDMTGDTLVYCVGYDFYITHSQPATAPKLLKDLWADADASQK